ncbi:SRPBCC family protein [Paenibacillus sp. V4I7]|uniref:SRPBCC family protein n=1 Tax=Paenibacillus sp. V4I7 TaxID=3042307 RepID=UPI0027843448|nr:SRPBCC family protein [Paenibacillus sp. V4I7]MDQ0898213.1 ligand-binding SRPBCC domain-containing protein [Paenibacillus sp. V4I7]
MPTIRQELLIHAPIEVCFDLARSIDIHAESTSHTKERAIAGRIQGLIEHGETVTWEAYHLGIKQQLTAQITEMVKPYYFVDEMVRGAFKRFRHTHEFVTVEQGTLMVDTFDYTSPFGGLGRLADHLFLAKYMTRFLEKRNNYVKKIAEETANSASSAR